MNVKIIVLALTMLW